MADDRAGIIGGRTSRQQEKETSGYIALVEIGMRDFAFEAVVLRHPESFSGDAVTRSRERLAQFDGPEQQA
jgi:hypothetical protein